MDVIRKFRKILHTLNDDTTGFEVRKTAQFVGQISEYSEEHSGPVTNIDTTEARTSDDLASVRKRKRKAPHTQKDSIYYVLKELGQPTHYNKIHAELKKKFPKYGSGRPGSVFAILSQYSDIFVKVSHGIYALKEWTIGNTIQIQTVAAKPDQSSKQHRTTVSESSKRSVTYQSTGDYQHSRLTYRRTAVKSFDPVPPSSILKLRLLDLIDRSEDYDADILDKLARIPLSHMELSDSRLYHLRSCNIFPDDRFDGLSCCTLSYLSKLVPEDDEWMDFLLEQWRSLIREHLSECKFLDVAQLADKEQLVMSDLPVPESLKHLPTRVLSLPERTVSFLESLGIATLSDIGKFSEIEIMKRAECISHALKVLRDLYLARQDAQQKDWTLLLDFLNKPIDQFMMDSTCPANVKQRDMNIFLMCKGFVTGESSTLSEVGSRFGITRERVRQIVTSVTDSMDSARMWKRLDLSLLVNVIESLVFELGGVTDFKCLVDKLMWGSHPDSISPFLEFLSGADSRICVKSDLVTIWQENWVTKLLEIVERYLAECGKPMLVEDICKAKPMTEYLEESDIKLSGPILEILTKWNQSLGILPDGRIGIKEWKRDLPRTKKERVYYILKTAGRPMHYTDAHTELLKTYPGRYSQNTQITLSAFQNYRDVFELVDPGTYALKEWNSKPYITVGNAAENALKETGEPLTYAEIRKGVWEIRDCPEGNIKVALGQKRFARVGSDRWDLAERLALAGNSAKADRLRKILEKVPAIRKPNQGKVREPNEQKGVDGFEFVNSLRHNRIGSRRK